MHYVHAYTRIHVYKVFVYTYQEHEVLHSIKPLNIFHIYMYTILYMYTIYGVFFWLDLASSSAAQYVQIGCTDVNFASFTGRDY